MTASLSVTPAGLIRRSVVEVALPAEPSATTAVRVAVIIVTWNRRELAAAALEAVARQTGHPATLDVVVIDNASTDATLEYLTDRFHPERIIDNPTRAAHLPNFQSPRQPVSTANTLGLASLTLVRNADNFGGCGGFNTGFALVEHATERGYFPRPDCLWLVDDDIDLPPDALANLVGVMAEDPVIGLVGSRTCDIRDRERTIESTIYFNHDNGFMQDEVPGHDPRRREFEAFRARTGGVRGRGRFRGTMNVDVVSACSMLARWDAVVGPRPSNAPRGALLPSHPAQPRSPVGFWDHRYFIYCDDADWCLRFAKRGWRVVLSLDAVVYHTPWLLKLTPARIYYANRNRLWMGRKVLSPRKLRDATLRGARSLLRESLYALLHRRLLHANTMLAALEDARTGRAGKTGSDGPPALPLNEALDAAGALPGARVAVLCNTPESIKLFDDLAAALAARECSPTLIRFINRALKAPARSGDVRYSNAWPARALMQLRIAALNPVAAVIFDQNCDLPMLGLPGRSPEYTLHIDQRRPTHAQLERDTWQERLSLLRHWLGCAWRSIRWARSITPVEHTTRYG